MVLNDDAVLLAYNIDCGRIVGMPPVVEVCRFMGNEQLALESIAGGEARVLRLDDDKTAMTFVAQHTGTVG